MLRTRIRIHRAEGNINIAIAPRRSLADLAAGVVVVVVVAGVMTTCGYGIYSQTMVRSEPSGAMLFMGFCLIGLLLFASLAGVAVCWRIFGREEIVIGRDVMRLSAILMGLRRVRSFDLAVVGEPYVQERRYRAKGHRLIQRSVSFESRGQQASTTSQLSQRDAEYLATELRRGLEEQRSDRAVIPSSHQLNN